MTDEDIEHILIDASGSDLNSSIDSVKENDLSSVVINQSVLLTDCETANCQSLNVSKESINASNNDTKSASVETIALGVSLTKCSVTNQNSSKCDSNLPLSEIHFHKSASEHKENDSSNSDSDMSFREAKNVILKLDRKSDSDSNSKSLKLSFTTTNLSEQGMSSNSNSEEDSIGNGSKKRLTNMKLTSLDNDSKYSKNKKKYSSLSNSDEPLIMQKIKKTNRKIPQQEYISDSDSDIPSKNDTKKLLRTKKDSSSSDINSCQHVKKKLPKKLKRKRSDSSDNLSENSSMSKILKSSTRKYNSNDEPNDLAGKASHIISHKSKVVKVSSHKFGTDSERISEKSIMKEVVSSEDSDEIPLSNKMSISKFHVLDAKKRKQSARTDEKLHTERIKEMDISSSDDYDNKCKPIEVQNTTCKRRRSFTESSTSEAEDKSMKPNHKKMKLNPSKKNNNQSTLLKSTSMNAQSSGDDSRYLGSDSDHSPAKAKSSGGHNLSSSDDETHQLSRVKTTKIKPGKVPLKPGKSVKTSTNRKTKESPKKFDKMEKVSNEKKNKVNSAESSDDVPLHKKSKVSKVLLSILHINFLL